MLSVLVASGIANGLIYALIALGIVILAKSTGTVNFCHGDLATLGGFVSFTVLVGAGLGAGTALLCVIAVALVLGLVLFSALRRMFKPEHSAGLLIATIGASFLLKGAMRLIWGSQGDYFTTPPLSSAPPVILVGGTVILPTQQLVVMVGAVAILAIFAAFFSFTQAGLYMRAVADNPRAARIIGIPGNRILALAFCLSVLVAAVSGFLFAPSTLLYPDLGFPLFVKGFAAAVLGGIFSLPGAVVGGVLLGLLETLVAGYVASQFQDLSAFVVIFLTLLFLPGGLFGQTAKRAV